MYYWMGFDLETQGEIAEFALQPWRFRQRREGRPRAWISTAAFSMRGLDGSMVSRGRTFPTKAQLREILAFAIKHDMHVVTWNGVFDIAWLIAVGLEPEVLQVKWIDAMRMWKHLDISSSFAATAGHTYALKGEHGAVGRWCPEMLGYEDGVDYQTQDPDELAKLLAYNKHDTAATLMAAEGIWAKLDDKRRNAFLSECACLPLVAGANVRGMLVDQEAVARLDAKLVETAERMEEKLEPHGITRQVVASPMQLAKVMFGPESEGGWGLHPLKRGKPTKKNPAGEASTDKDSLSQLSTLDDRADDVRKFREALGLRSKFIGGMVKSLAYNEDGYTRPAANVFGTYTGRFTYNSTIGKKGTKKERQIGFALHQMKRDKEFKDMVVAPEGYDLVEFDAAGQEFRWMAIHSGDEVMLQLCLPGEDAHSYMGDQISGLGYRVVQKGAEEGDAACKRARQGGKVGNLSLQYRTSAPTFQVRSRTDHGLIISLGEAETICKTYKRAYKGVPAYWRSQIEKGRRLGYAETMAGRRVQVLGNWSGPQQWPMESTMINYPIQGTGGDQKYLALQILRDELPRYDARFAWDLHDGIYFYVPKTKSLAFAHRMKEILDNLPYVKAWGFRSPIPLPWDAKVGPSWGALKNIG